jgi:putative DNA primase/helicase
LAFGIILQAYESGKCNNRDDAIDILTNHPNLDVAIWARSADEAEVDRLWAEVLRLATPPPRPSELTEDAAALIFTNQYREQLRFCHDTGAWFQWNGSIWRRETTALAFDRCRSVCRLLGKGDKTFGKANTAAGVERFARASRNCAVTAEIWDKDLFLLGTPDGTVEIQTGTLRDARPEDYITKSTLVAPSDDANCPIWLKFLDEATRGDTELILFLQRWCGYCLTGDVREHALLFIFGDGGNGKGTFLNTVSRIFGDYAAVVAMETFTASPHVRHPTELAMLRGARLVYVSETEEGQAWAENRIKSLTGGDPITARFMRQDFFTY